MVQNYKVSRNSKPGKVAGAIAAAIKEDYEVQVSAVGPHATHIATLAIAIARDFLSKENTEIACIPEIIRLNGESEKTIRIMRFSVRTAA